MEVRGRLDYNVVWPSSQNEGDPSIVMVGNP